MQRGGVGLLGPERVFGFPAGMTRNAEKDSPRPLPRPTLPREGDVKRTTSTREGDERLVTFEHIV